MGYMSVEKQGSTLDSSARADFEALLLKAAAASFECRQPNFEAVMIACILLTGDLESLDTRVVARVFADADLFFEISRVPIMVGQD